MRLHAYVQYINIGHGTVEGSGLPTGIEVVVGGRTKVIPKQRFRKKHAPPYNLRKSGSYNPKPLNP